MIICVDEPKDENELNIREVKSPRRQKSTSVIVGTMRLELSPGIKLLHFILLYILFYFIYCYGSSLPNQKKRIPNSFEVHFQIKVLFFIDMD